jgi:acyl-CoA thioesterase
VDADEKFDLSAAVAETLDFLTVRPDGDAGDVWVGDAPDWFGDVLFGGFVIAQAIIAATRNPPPGRRLHSLHAYFLRPVVAASSIAYGVRPIRDGRSFASRHATTSICTVRCSVSQPTGRVSAAGRCTSKATRRA